MKKGNGWLKCTNISTSKASTGSGGKDQGSRLPSTGAISSENRQPAVIKKQVMKGETLNRM